MFTGIIEASAQIIKKSDSGIIVERPNIFTNLQIGQSIAVNGACLSIVEFDEKSMRFDVVPETFSRTNLGDAKRVNLERAMAANGRFEGHIVLGHVDGTAELIEKKQEGEGMRYTFSLPNDLALYCVEKGSICINGVSLTIAKTVDSKTPLTPLVRGEFQVALIPHTLENTNLGNLDIGEKVNVEADYFAKLLKKWHSA